MPSARLVGQWMQTGEDCDPKIERARHYFTEIDNQTGRGRLISTSSEYGVVRRDYKIKEEFINTDIIVLTMHVGNEEEVSQTWNMGVGVDGKSAVVDSIYVDGMARMLDEYEYNAAQAAIRAGRPYTYEPGEEMEWLVLGSCYIKVDDQTEPE